MKILLLSVVICFSLLSSGSDMNRLLAEENDGSRLVAETEQIFSSATIQENNSWMELYLLMKESFLSAWQIDFSADYHLFFKTLPAFLVCRIQAGGRMPGLSGFMRFLSDRHTAGFYIYFLKKLII